MLIRYEIQNLSRLYSEIRMGIVWTTSSEIETNLIKIKNPKNGKSIIVAHRCIDDNYIKIYNSSYNTNRLKGFNNSNEIIIDEYYRKKINVSKNSDVELLIIPVKPSQLWSNLSYLQNHPNEIIKITFWFTFLTFLFTLFSYVVSYEKLVDIICLTKNYIINFIMLLIKKQC